MSLCGSGPKQCGKDGERGLIRALKKSRTEVKFKRPKKRGSGHVKKFGLSEKVTKVLRPRAF